MGIPHCGGMRMRSTVLAFRRFCWIKPCAARCEDFQPGGGRVPLAAAGKAAWRMGLAAVQTLGRVDGGVVVTKHGHVKGRIPGVNCYEAGHPVPMPTALQPPKKLWRWYRG